MQNVGIYLLCKLTHCNGCRWKTNWWVLNYPTKVLASVHRPSVYTARKDVHWPPVLCRSAMKRRSSKKRLSKTSLPIQRQVGRIGSALIAWSLHWENRPLISLPAFPKYLITQHWQETFRQNQMQCTLRVKFCLVNHQFQFSHLSLNKAVAQIVKKQQDFRR